GRRERDRALTPSPTDRLSTRLLGRLGHVPARRLEVVPERLRAGVPPAALGRGRVPCARRLLLGRAVVAARPPELRRRADAGPVGLGAPALPLDRRAARADRPIRVGVSPLPAALRALHVPRSARARLPLDVL